MRESLFKTRTPPKTNKPRYYYSIKYLFSGSIGLIGKNRKVLNGLNVYVIELALKLSPLTLSVERKGSNDAETLYQRIRQAMVKGDPRLLELTCENVEDKKVSVLTTEVIGVQLYEKNTSSLGSKKPGFSFGP